MKLFRGNISQYMTFYLYPFFLALGISIIYTAEITMYQNVIVVVSIFVSMLFAMLSMLISKNYQGYSQEQKERIKAVLKETNNAILFCVFICIMIIHKLQ